MNNRMIEKLYKISNECPEFSFENPLLDRNVTKALSKSFVKILNVLQQNPRSNTNLRFSILETIRKSCQIEQMNHIKIDDNLTEIISEFHSTHLKQQTALETEETIYKHLDAFLLRRIEDCEVSAKCKAKINPEVIQSLINLRQNGIFDTLSEDVINWNVQDSKQRHILEEIFVNDNITGERKLLDDVFIKMAPKLEKFFLEIGTCLIEESTTGVESLFSDNVQLKQLIKTCAISPKGFQMCSSILNFMFISSNCNQNMQRFISMFVNLVKSNCSHTSFHSLYPTHVNHIVLLLDFNDEDLSHTIGNVFIKETVKYLKNLHNKEESELIMLLSHFPRWFDIYFDSEYSTN